MAALLRLGTSSGAALLIFLAFAVISGCRTTYPTHPDDRYSYRFDGFEAGRETIEIRPLADHEDYFIYPVIIDSVHVRHGLFEADSELAGQSVPVDVLVKGSFPDACMELHELRQQRFASLIRVELSMRRPRRVRCERMVRPYRFYFELEGTYAMGHYSLTINGEPYPFQVRGLTERR